MDELYASEGDGKLGGEKKILSHMTSTFELFALTYLQLGNHDNSRVGSRYGSERIDALNAVLLTLPGAGVTYNVMKLETTCNFSHRQAKPWSDEIHCAASD